MASSYRRIYEQYYGVKIPKGHHIHHKDMNHDNNDPLNLEALHPDDHAQKHGFLTNFIMAGARSLPGNKRGLGHTKSAEVRETIGAKNRGRVPSDEARAKMSASHTGLKASAETRNKMRLSQSTRRANDRP